MKSVMVLVIVWMMGSVTASFAQQTGQQQQQMQQQMQQMNQMMDRMNQLMDRTHMMNQEMNRRMQQVQDEQVRGQYQMLHRFNEQIQMALGNMKNAAERCNLMLQDRQMMRDPSMMQDMEQLRRHLHDMTGQAEEAVQTMERLTKRLHQQQPTGGNN